MGFTTVDEGSMYHELKAGEVIFFKKTESFHFGTIMAIQGTVNRSFILSAELGIRVHCIRLLYLISKAR